MIYIQRAPRNWAHFMAVGCIMHRLGSLVNIVLRLLLAIIYFRCLYVGLEQLQREI